MMQSSIDMLTFSWDAKLDQRSQSHQLPTSPPTEEVVKAMPQKERMTESKELEGKGKEKTARKGRGKGRTRRRGRKKRNLI